MVHSQRYWLALHWAHRVADRYPDGQLYVNLRGFDPSGTPMTSAEAVRGLLGALVPGALPADTEDQLALYHSLLTDRRVLILLDNARDAEQVRPLLPVNPTCLVLVTSRRQLTGLTVAQGAYPITLGLLSRSEAHELLSRRLGPELVANEARAADELIRLCARLPLALCVAAAHAAQTMRPLRDVAQQLGHQPAAPAPATWPNPRHRGHHHSRRPVPSNGPDSGSAPTIRATGAGYP